MENTDRYNTITKTSEEVLFKEKKSKFFGYAFPIVTEEEVKPIIEALKKKYPTANHVCYAWQLGLSDKETYRTNDDGEPNNSAGMPIYRQIQSFKLTNVLVAVVRVFGGTKLGVGGLITAYKTTAQMALETATIIEKIIQQQFLISFDYEQMNIVMRTIKQYQLEIISQKMDLKCTLVITVGKQKTLEIKTLFTAMQKVTIRVVS